MKELIVVAAHGPDFAGQCMASLPPATPKLLIDTGSYTVPSASFTLAGGHPTAAYLWAYGNTDADRFLFIQDSMTALTDPLPWFRDQWPGTGAVAWGRFPMQWDSQEQVDWVQSQYPGVNPAYGIMGPIFYTDRPTLDLLAGKQLFPRIPVDKHQAKGTERAWAYALAAAGLPLAGPEWNYHQMQVGFGPFKKVWADRP